MDEKKLLKEKIYFYFRINKYRLIVLYTATLLSNLINLIPMYLFGIAIDYALNGNFERVVKTIVTIVITFIATAGLSVIETILYRHINQDIIINSKEEIYKKILNLKRKELNGIKSGQLMSKIEEDSVHLANFITDDIIQIVISSITIIVSLYLVIKLSLVLSIISIITFPLTIVLTNILGKKIRKYISREQILNDEYYSGIQETFVAIEEIKSLGIEKLLLKKYKNTLKNIKNNSIEMTYLNTKMNFFSSTISSLGEWLILLAASFMIINNTLTVGTLVAFNSFCAKLTSSVAQLAQFNVKIQRVLLSLKRIDDLLKLPDENEFITNYSPELTGDIRIKNLCFSYENQQIILKNINLQINKKQLYVIVGKNGCGKSTLLNLILHFFEANEGEILFNNYNIKDIDIEHLRSSIAYIPQQPYIFQGTINYNLALSKNEALEEERDIACEMVGLDSFIKNLPDKYNTIIGKEGIGLSGGQKQKLAIARSILKEPKIMILDEITSDLDSKAEVEIMNMLNKLSEQFTIVTVGHRISSILYCPNIIVMDEGEIVGIGNHESLIKNCDVYKDLYKEQLDKIKEKV